MNVCVQEGPFLQERQGGATVYATVWPFSTEAVTVCPSSALIPPRRPLTSFRSTRAAADSVSHTP